MFDEKTILTRLQNGEDIQKIADEFAASLNAANKTYTDQKVREEELRKANEIQKKADLQDILDQFALWFGQYYGYDETIDADDVMKLIDEIQGYLQSINSLTKIIKKPTIVKTNSPDETLNAFLNKMGW